MNDVNLPDVPKSGRFGDWVYYMRNGKQYRRRYVKPRDTRTPEQLRLRTAFGAASHAYSWELTEEQRQECRAAGAKVGSRPRLAQSGRLSGQHYLIKREAAEARAKQPPKPSRHGVRRRVQ
jgi:hypothetical protein